ncbi:hypothetical protein BDV98DRAFT_584113 [Pterulicium gracile]|uniref:RTA1 like protein-domain-containing protein n=1 Tax=Pterulicium gracile TaxID=1884261 RepID=A0A5C3QG28_9AGAR|nr:hypothetical protein BDV98DRAFT_584113 [Pterula gracilis]
MADSDITLTERVYLLFMQTFEVRSWWSLCLPIGAFYSLMLYILTQLVIICSPAAFLAFNYILYGRLLADNVRPEYSMMRPAIVSKVFIISDVSTFFLQVSGGGMTATEKMASAGKSLMVFGLCAQLLSYVVFWVMFTVLHVRAHKAAEWAVPSDHFLITSEASGIFYAVDVVALFLRVSIYCFYLPASYISQTIEKREAWNPPSEQNLPLQNHSYPPYAFDSSTANLRADPYHTHKQV